ncbi:MAG: acyl-CoA thioesterase [Chitinophagia bacterium]|jgi:acyl-CoA thioesterase FadM|nr:acyl-CoA thioesterase [Chitinophagia bacterium]
MARIKIDFPDNIIASIKLKVRIGDINYGNHVGNDAFVSLIHEARLQWLLQNNFSEINAGGTGLIMADLGIEYKKEAYYGEEILIEIGTGEIARVSFELYYQLSTERNQEKVLLAKAKTGMVCYNYDLKKTVSVPESLQLILQAG